MPPSLLTAGRRPAPPPRPVLPVLRVLSPRPLFAFLFSLFTAALCAASASATEFSPLQIGLNGIYEPFNRQLVSENTPVYGLRLNLLISYNEFVTGLDIGLGSAATTFTGLRLNAISWTDKTTRGVDVSLFCLGAEESEFDGIQIAGMVLAHHVRGIQAGLLTYGDIRGVQMGLWNTAIDLRGLQIGLVNFIDNPDAPFTGLQIGLVNRAETLHGLQIGLLNIVPGSSLPVLPLLRASF